MRSKRTLSLKKLNYREKIRLTIYATIFIFSILALLTNLIWRQSLVGQIYDNAYTQTNSVATSINEQLTTVQDLTFDIISNELIQTNLTELYSENLETKKNSLKSDLQYSLNQMTNENKTIKKLFLLDTSADNLTSFISDRNNLLPGTSVETVLESLPDEPAKGQWFFSPSLSQAIYARNIFSIENLDHDFLGTIIIVLDTSFISKTLSNNIEMSEDALFFLNYQEKFIYNVDEDQSYTSLIHSLQEEMYDGSQTLDSLNFNHVDYYLSTIEKDDFTYFFLLPNRQVLKNVTSLQLILLLIAGFIIVFLTKFFVGITDQLTSPIISLAKNMEIIPKSKELDDLTAIALPDNQTEEIVTLYNSYNAMIDEIGTLINDNYKMKVLSQEIEFVALQSQLNPHFLYNTLDSINWLAIAQDQKEISQMVTSLSFLFRKKIASNSPMTTLEEELELVNAYVTIQEIRFKERVDFIPLILIEDLSIEVPKLLIQPLIENAFKYAVEKMSSPCEIILKIEQVENDLVIKCIDNGPGFPKNYEERASTGIGLKNIRERLLLTYGEGSSLSIESIPYECTTVTIKIPL